MPDPQETPLDDKEMQRVDALLSSARSFHHFNFVVAALAIAMSSIEAAEDFALSIGGLGLGLPRTQAAVGVYLVSIALAVASDTLYRRAAPWIMRDPRRPPFPWIALGAANVPHRAAVFLWLLVPVVLTAVAVSLTLEEKVPDFGLLLPGLFLVGSGRIFEEYCPLIRSATDHRGGPATFSIWLLYCYRVVRSAVFTCAFFFPILAVVPKWRSPMLKVSAFFLSIFILIYVVRLIAVFPFIYRRIDRFGTRFGFPPKSPHYD